MDKKFDDDKNKVYQAINKIEDEFTGKLYGQYNNGKSHSFFLEIIIFLK